MSMPGIDVGRLGAGALLFAVVALSATLAGCEDEIAGSRRAAPPPPGSTKIAPPHVPDPPAPPQDPSRECFVEVVTPQEASVMAAAIGDVNDDRRVDVATLTFDDDLVVLLGDGRGGFAKAGRLALGSDAYGVQLHDVNGDERLDVLIAHPKRRSVDIRLGDGAGGFGEARSLATGSSAESPVLVDVNGDSRDDMLVALKRSIAIFHGDGVGNFKKASSLSTGLYPCAPLPFDLDGDGLLDLAAACNDDHFVQVFGGKKGGRFGPGRRYATGRGPTEVAAGDLDGDGRPDLATPNINSVTATVMFGRPGNTFERGSEIDDCLTLAVHDFDGDGVAELILGKRAPPQHLPGPQLRKSSGAVEIHTLRVEGVPEPLVQLRIAGLAPDAIWVARVDGDDRHDLLLQTQREIIALLARPCAALSGGSTRNTRE